MSSIAFWRPRPFDAEQWARLRRRGPVVYALRIGLTFGVAVLAAEFLAALVVGRGDWRLAREWSHANVRPAAELIGGLVWGAALTALSWRKMERRYAEAVAGGRPAPAPARHAAGARDG